jgi:hypothetical protein
MSPNFLGVFWLLETVEGEIGSRRQMFSSVPAIDGD